MLTARDRLLLGVLCGAVFLDSMGVSLMTIAVPSLQDSLDLSAESGQWIVSGYTVAFGGMLLFGGRLVDVLGSRTVFLIGLALLSGGGIASGVTEVGEVVIASRVITGVGAALVAPASLSALLTRFNTPKRRATALRVYSGAGATGYGAGLVISGALTSLDWRVTVLVPAALAGVLLLIGGAILSKGAPTRRRSLNAGGSFLGTVALLSVVFVIVTGPPSGWTAVTFVAVAVALVAATLFVTVERVHADPLLPRALVQSTTLVAGNVLAFFWAAASIGWQFIAALFLADELGFTPLVSGLAILPLAVMIVLTQIAARKWSARTAPFIVGAVGMAVQGVGIVWFLVAIQSGDYWTGVLPGVILHGIGNGLVFPVFFAQATNSVPDNQNGVASALVNTSVQVGSGIGVAVASALFTASGSSYTAAFSGAAAFSLVGAVWAFLRLRRPHRSRSPRTKGKQPRNTAADRL